MIEFSVNIYRFSHTIDFQTTGVLDSSTLMYALNRLTIRKDSIHSLIIHHLVNECKTLDNTKQDVYNNDMEALI